MRRKVCYKCMHLFKLMLSSVLKMITRGDLMEVEVMDRRRIVPAALPTVWQPLWKSMQPMPLMRNEREAIEQICYAVKISVADVTPVRSGDGEKCLRFRVFDRVEQQVDMYRYYFFGPIMMEGSEIYYLQKRKKKTRKEFIDIIKRALDCDPKGFVP